ncbi:MAG: hypothetical protein U5O69_10370 [Candidatus Competibacteraceae bacterium]|nr:hypothetical protein [Candidatus Competibacteraceae bacterium]
MGSTFVGWSGACSGAAETCQVTMNCAARHRRVPARYPTSRPQPMT